MKLKVSKLTSTRRAVMALALGILPLVSCGTRGNETSKPFPEFSFVPTPRSDLQVGARVVGGEIVGDGLDPSQLVVQRSWSTSIEEKSSVSQAAIEASVLSLFGVSAEVAREKNLRVEYSGIETVKVKSPILLDPIPGAEYVYAGLRVSGLVISADDSLITELAAKATISPATLEIAVNPFTGRSSLRQTGEGLYVGVQKIRFKSIEFQQHEEEITGLEVNGQGFDAGAGLWGTSWTLVAEIVALPIRDCLDASFSDQISDICRVPLTDLFPDGPVLINFDTNWMSAALYDEECGGPYRVVFHDVDAIDEIVGEASYDYNEGERWEYRLPTRLLNGTATTAGAIATASVFCNEFYYHVWQTIEGSSFHCSGGATPYGTMVLSEKIYHYELLPPPAG